jgi:hypothetical protein
LSNGYEDDGRPENIALMADTETLPTHSPDRLHEDMSREYYAIVDAVSGFDQRLMTIKGWSVTLSLVGLGLGFQQGHYALFALAAGTALAFWYLDALNKRYQLRYYSRMRDIEVAAHSLNNVNLQLKVLREDHSDAKTPLKSKISGTGMITQKYTEVVFSAPRIDWSWAFKGKPKDGDWRNDPPIRRTSEEIRDMLLVAPLRPNVFLPHAVAVILGIGLFLAAWADAPGFSALTP